MCVDGNKVSVNDQLFQFLTILTLWLGSMSANMWISSDRLLGQTKVRASIGTQDNLAPIGKFRTHFGYPSKKPVIALPIHIVPSGGHIGRDETHIEASSLVPHSARHPMQQGRVDGI